MNTILQIKYYDLETGNEIPMSQEEEEKQKKRWRKLLDGFLYGIGALGGAWVLGFFWGIGSGGGPFEVKRITITAVGRPGTNK